MRFELQRTVTGGLARAGKLTTLHGAVDTPVFMPVGTRGTVRTQSTAQLEAIGASIVLANTYHLLMRPGTEILERFGGLHRYMDWSGAILTDSGGFQVYSLGGAVCDEEGARLRHPTEGTSLLLTPERSIAVQRSIGSDIMMVFDQCIDARSPEPLARAAMERTHRWARRSLDARGDSPQALFAIVQGACVPELRRESAAVLTAMPGFDGYAIGGLAVGESKAEREDITELTAPLLPADRPRYLMGVGTPLDILEAVHRGVDMFDCILPTAWAQHGKAFTSHGKLDLRRGVYRAAEQRLDARCSCEGCTRYSRAYLHHLIKCEEPLGWQLLASHNLRFYCDLMREIRAHIVADTFAMFYAQHRDQLALADPDNPPSVQASRRARTPLTRGAFEVVESDSCARIRHLASGEVMHPIDHPDREADRVYVAQSRQLTMALATKPESSPRSLIVWDVGLGAAHNAMALVRALDAAGEHTPVELVSFERDLDALRLALANLKQFVHLRHPAPNIVNARGRFERPGLTWRLCEGDFAETFASQPPPDVIFWDPFSAKVDRPMWSFGLFRAVHAHVTARGALTELFTYSASTAMRSSLLAAGFFVARGVASGAKEETTIALTGVDPTRPCPYPLLGTEWLARRARSTSRYPTDVAPEVHAELERAIAQHSQFSRTDVHKPLGA